MSTENQPHEALQRELIQIAEQGIQSDVQHLKEDFCAQFADPFEFIREYVVNAYDAQATQCIIHGRESREDITITIQDNGHGMNKEGAVNFFTLYRSRKFGDPLKTVGRFGIGKLSVAAIPGQNTFLMKTSTGSDCWEARAGSLLSNDPIDLFQIRPIPPAGTTFEITFQKKDTLALAIKFYLSKKLGRVVINLSTSRAVDDIVKYYNCELTKTKVGEINVADKMRDIGAVIGGEGNGGVILPDIHLGRDAPVAAALTLQYLAEQGTSLTELKQSLPQYYILKDKAPLGEVDPDDVIAYLGKQNQDKQLDYLDGLRIDRPDAWIHLRKSNTEPIMRIIVEARTPDIAWHILQETKEMIAQVKTG